MRNVVILGDFIHKIIKDDLIPKLFRPAYHERGKRHSGAADRLWKFLNYQYSGGQNLLLEKKNSSI